MVDINQTCFVLWQKKYLAYIFLKDFLQMLKSCLIEVNETFVSLMISCRVRVGISWSKTSLPMEDIWICPSCSSVKMYFILEKNAEPSLWIQPTLVQKNPRDQSQIRHLACQMFPSKPKFLQVAYEDATKDPYRYLFLDFHPNSPELARVRGNIFPYDLLDDSCCLYLPKYMQI